MQLAVYWSVDPAVRRNSIRSCVVIGCKKQLDKFRIIDIQNCVVACCCWPRLCFISQSCRYRGNKRDTFMGCDDLGF